eukprot:Mycagemm_TRINITY_DN10182_c0_g2::TRINITY_DN10182_c0_g2_i1::g.5204::m.5204 type:complete len:111 gc:universal TRINITY_DN10182_c0_g2_i1:670-338(-)
MDPRRRGRMPPGPPVHRHPHRDGRHSPASSSRAERPCPWPWAPSPPSLRPFSSCTSLHRALPPLSRADDALHYPRCPSPDSPCACDLGQAPPHRDRAPCLSSRSPQRPHE